jgi:hypothetical protein
VRISRLNKRSEVVSGSPDGKSLSQDRQREDHRRYRGSAGDCQDPYSSRPTRPRPASLPGAASRSIPNSLRAETGCQRKPTTALGLAFEQAPRRGTNKALPTAESPAPTKQNRHCHYTLVRLTTRRSGAIAPVNEKRCLNFLYKVILPRK